MSVYLPFISASGDGPVAQSSPRERGNLVLGVGIPWQMEEYYPGAYSRALSLLKPPFWYNWQWRDYKLPGNVPMIWQAKRGAAWSAAVNAARTIARRTWLIGNEPERAGQSDTSPAEFAAAMEEWRDSKLRWAGPGILWGDEGRAWIQEYLALPRRVRPNYWAIHIYGSTTVAGWLDQYNHAVAWFAGLGFPNPIWVTETNGSEAILRYLAGQTGITAYWYSARDPFGHNGAHDLCNADGTALTPLGRVYSAVTAPA